MRTLKPKDYYLPANHPAVKNYGTQIDAMMKRQLVITLPVPWTAVEEMNNIAIVEFICAAQHKKEWLAHAVYNVLLKFEGIPDSEPVATHENIFTNPKIVKWLAFLGKVPFLPFFLNSPELRLYTIAGDQIMQGQTEVNPYGEYSTDIGFSSEQFKGIFDHLWQCCIAFTDYCSSTGVVAKPFIEQMIEQLSEPLLGTGAKTFSANDVYKEWKHLKENKNLHFGFGKQQ